MKKSPLAIVKERFGDKNGLVKAVKELLTDDLTVDRLNADKGLDSVSNKKLLHLHQVLSAVKSQFGSRGGLIEQVAEAEGRGKDADYKTALQAQATPALYARYRAAKKRAAKEAA